MPRNLLLSGLLPAVVVAMALVVLPLEIVTEAQQQTPAGPAPAATGRAGGRGLGGGRDGGPTVIPSALRAIPAETRAAKAKDPNWKAPRTAWGHPGVIPLDNRPHIASSIKQYMGDARGRCEGDTLVVETTNFTDKTSFSGLHSDQLKLTEWFTRIDSCHEGNGAVGYALSGERAYERMVDEAKAKGLPIPPRTMGMEVYSGGQVEGRQPVRELGGAR